MVVSFGVCADCGCGEQPADVFDHDPLRLQRVDCCRHVRPEAGAGAGFEAGHLPDRGYVLAGEPSAEDVYRRYGIPIDGGDISEVRGLGPMVGKDAGHGFIDLGKPNRSCVKDFLDGDVEPTVPGEERPDT